MNVAIGPTIFATSHEPAAISKSAIVIGTDRDPTFSLFDFLTKGKCRVNVGGPLSGCGLAFTMSNAVSADPSAAKTGGGTHPSADSDQPGIPAGFKPCRHNASTVLFSAAPNDLFPPVNVGLSCIKRQVRSGHPMSQLQPKRTRPIESERNQTTGPLICIDQPHLLD